MKSVCLLALLLTFTAASLPGKEIATKMAVTRGQTTVDLNILPLVCITFVLDHAALPISEIDFTNTISKERWYAKVGSLDPRHPKVLTAMQGDHRSLVMVILHVQPGRYEFDDLEFEGRGGSRFFFFVDDPGPRYFFDVKPNCANFVGSLVIGAKWDLLSGAGGKFKASIAVEQTASRDKKWASDVVPGMAALQSEESIIVKDEPNHTAEPGSPSRAGSP